MRSAALPEIVPFLPLARRNPKQSVLLDHATIGGHAMAPFQELLVEHLPHLRSFAWYLARDRHLADDLVQETAIRALCNSDKFTPGTNMGAWLSTILRNQFYNELRSRSRLAAFARIPQPTSHASEQDGRLEMRDFERAFHSLPALQREALSLVGVSGFSYEDAAKIVGCAEGTIKSRVCRARKEIDRYLGRNEPRQSSAASSGTKIAA